MASKGMDAEGSSRALAGAGAGAGDGWLPQQPPWKPNWRVDYCYSSCSRGSSSYTSTPGTAHSTPSSYTNTSGGSLIITPSPQSSHGLDLSCRDGGEGSKKSLEYIKCLLQEFSVANGDVSVLESWLSEIMGVRRQIGAADDASATSLLYFAGSWIRALTGITESVRNIFVTDMLGNILEEERPSHINSARFAETCISKMLPFVDALVVAPCFRETITTSSSEIVLVGDGAPAAPAEKLGPLIGVREAVSRASQDIRLSCCSTSSEEAKRITDEMADLLLTKEAKLDEAIWNTMEEVRTRLLSSWWGSQTCHGSSDIHKATRATISYIHLLSNHCPTLHQIVDQAAQLRGYAPKIDNISPLTSLMMETVSCLEEKLAENSRSFTDPSLGFLFVVNNSYFIWQQLYPTTSVLESQLSNLTRKIDNYIETYLQMSWAPVLSCLYNSTPLCLGRIYSSPAKFESEFQKTYAAQKLWKVPDPKLRRRLRVAVTEKVVSSFTKYLEYNNISPLRITPQDLMDMLQELFEG
ncbi:unnamed protein product [Urochloa decumbens]|uniref:Exocyst subunit Exo70 family protein n=1 Tax=Urochloa decumbens TaxID=240449 RepID=A0ABC8ZUX5_9POAL